MSIKQDLIDWTNDGLTIKDIATELSVDRKTVYRWYVDYGVEFNSRNPLPTPTRKRLLSVLKRFGSISGSLPELKASRETVRQWMKVRKLSMAEVYAST